MIAADLTETLAQIRALHRRNVFAIKMQIGVSNQLLAFVRVNYCGYRGDMSDKQRTECAKAAMNLIKACSDISVTTPDVLELRPIVGAAMATKEPWDVVRITTEKEMSRLVKKLPAFQWADRVSGFGAMSFARVVAETGDLSLYDDVSKVWKRMGLGLVDGGRQRKVAGDAALAHGYSPARRSIMFVIGDCIIRAQIRKVDDTATATGFYGRLYLDRKIVEADREGITKAHAHNRAKRYMEKRLLKDLWAQWNGPAVQAP